MISELKDKSKCPNCGVLQSFTVKIELDQEFIKEQVKKEFDLNAHLISKAEIEAPCYPPKLDLESPYKATFKL